MLDDTLGMLGHGLLEALGLQAAQPAGVTPVALGLGLVATQHDLVGIDDDDKVAGVGVRGVLGLVLATQNHGSLGGKAAKGNAVSVDEHPLALDLAWLGVMSRLLHLTPPYIRTVCGNPWTGWRVMLFIVREYGALQKKLSKDSTT